MSESIEPVTRGACGGIVVHVEPRRVEQRPPDGDTCGFEVVDLSSEEAADDTAAWHKGQPSQIGDVLRAADIEERPALTTPQRLALVLLKDGAAHRTWRKHTGNHGHVNARVAASLHALGLLRYAACESCGRGPSVPEVIITPAGQVAVGLPSRLEARRAARAAL